MESFLNVIIILAALAIAIGKSYQKMKNTTRPQVDPRAMVEQEEKTIVETPPAYAENLPPIPPLAKEAAFNINETKEEKVQKEPRPVEKGASQANPFEGIELRQAIIVSEILNRKY